MCRKVIEVGLIIAILLGTKAIAATQFAYQVTFNDKNNTPYSFSSPLTYLSSRALSRRAAQGIAIDSTDLPVNPAYIDSVLTLTGGEFHEASRWLNLCVVLVLDSNQIHALYGKPFISNIKLVGYYSPNILHRPANTTGGAIAPIAGARKTSSSDNLHYGDTWNQTSMVNGNYLYDLGYQGNGKLIAVLDAGFYTVDTDPGFNNLWASGLMVDKHNFTLASENVFNYGTHGTQVLSTMAGYLPGQFVGSAPFASYALYITEDNNSEQPIELINMLCGAEHADSLGADIITTSLGYNTFDNLSDNFNFPIDFDGKTTTTAKAANMATKKGILFVATAGNEGGDSWNMILTPGDADSALTIGSVDGTGSVWHTSGYGPNAAGQIKPDVCGLGHGAYVFTNPGDGASDGTSFSTPQIAGWAACLWEANPNATPYQIRQAIIRCASSYSAPGPHIGYGIPDFHCTEHVLNVKEMPPPLSVINWVIAAPDPFNDEIKLTVSPSASQDVDFTMIDMTGKTVASLHQFLFNGYPTSITLSVSYLPAGVYVLKAASATQQQVLKLEKL
jgi:serine protease AprX